MPAVENVNLTGHFLIAMPAMTDPYFARSVTFICDHNENGAMGVVINQPIDMTLDALFEQIKLQLSDPLASMPVHFGGPVQPDHGFVLHQPTGNWHSTIAVNDGIGLTASKDILEAVAQGTGPQKILVTLGYAGWDARQLEEEISQNAWLTVRSPDAKSQDAILFGLANVDKFDAAMQLLGVDPMHLSRDAGHA
jgi:putative transcriptional regulator